MELGIKNKSIWNGRSFKGKLFIHGEEGIGDEIMFSSLFNEAYLFHSRLSFALNSKILHPREVIERALKSWEANPEAISYLK